MDASIVREKYMNVTLDICQVVQDESSSASDEPDTDFTQNGYHQS